MRKARFTEEQMVAIQRQPTQLVERPNRDSGTHLFRSTDVSETIGRDHVVNLVVGNRRPHTIHLNFVVAANHAALSRPTIHQIAARTLAIISFEFRVEALMPFIMAHPVVFFLRRRAYKKKRPHCQEG